MTSSSNPSASSKISSSSISYFESKNSVDCMIVVMPDSNSIALVIARKASVPFIFPSKYSRISNDSSESFSESTVISAVKIGLSCQSLISENRNSAAYSSGVEKSIRTSGSLPNSNEKPINEKISKYL